MLLYHWQETPYLSRNLVLSSFSGNHAYRTVLIERLVEQREYERSDEFYPIDSDLIIEAIQYAQMIDRQNQPFSLIQ